MAHPDYNGPAFATFSIIALVLQIPIIITNAKGPRPNVPTTIMSTWFLLMNLCAAIDAISWAGPDVTKWWSGQGWCDIEIRLLDAATNGMLCAQIVTLWNLINMLKDRPTIVSQHRVVYKSLGEAVTCLFIPVVNLAIFTFTTQNRYTIIQYAGCTSSMDTSIANLICCVIWMPLLSLIAIVMMMIVFYLFFRRGYRTALQNVSFIPKMKPMQFARIVIFAIIITVVMVPMAMYVGIFNFVTFGKRGVSPLAWIHGKPPGWDTTPMMSLESTVFSMQNSASLASWIAVKYINLILSYFMFICFGTGSMAMETYREGYHLLRIDSIMSKVRKSSSETELPVYEVDHTPEWKWQYDDDDAFCDTKSERKNSKDKDSKARVLQKSISTPSFDTNGRTPGFSTIAQAHIEEDYDLAAPAPEPPVRNGWSLLGSTFWSSP